MIPIPPWLEESPHGCRLTLRIQAGARVNRLLDLESPALKIQLQAPAVEGKANAALLRFLQEIFNLPRANIKILRGEKSRSKWVEIKGLRAAEAGAAVLSHHKS